MHVQFSMMLVTPHISRGPRAGLQISPNGHGTDGGGGRVGEGDNGGEDGGGGGAKGGGG